MNIDEFIVQVAIAEHRVFADEIVTEMAESAKARGTGIAKRSSEYISGKMEEGKAVINEEELAAVKQTSSNEVSADDDDIVKRVKELLENYVKPAVEMDGGAIQFKSYNDGVVNLMLQGSCSGCPSSMITLKAGIEGMMKRMIPEVKEVVAEAE